MQFPFSTANIRPVPLLLYSYIATEMLAPFFASFIILYSVFFLVRLIPLLDVVLELKISLADFIRLFTYIFPHMLLYVIPMASMTGIIIGFTRLTNEREILVLKASGVSLKRLLPPVLILAVSISVLTGLFSVRLIPAGEVALKHLMFQLAKEKIDKGLQEKKFTETLGDMVVYVDRIDENDRWHGVYVSDMRNRVQPIVIMAQGGHLKAEINKMQVTIVLNSGTMHHSEGFDNQIIHFKRYQLQIPLKPPTYIDGDDVTVIGKGSMSQQQLIDAAQRYGHNTRGGVVFLTEFHHRLALPVGCFILSLLGLPLGLQTGPGKRATGIPIGLTFFILYYVLSTITRVLCEDLILPPLLGMWLPNIIFLIITVVIFKRVDREKPIISEWLQNQFIDLYNWALAPTVNLVGKYAVKILRWRPGYSEEPTVYYREGMLIHANTEGRIFHLPGCEHYDCVQCTIEFKNAKVAQEAGFEPCRYCRAKLKIIEQG